MAENVNRRAWRRAPVSMFTATVAGIGHVPGGPGTYAAALSVPALMWLSTQGWPLRIGLFAVVAVLSVYWCHTACVALDEHDSRRIVLDEVGGVWLALLPFSDIGWIPALVGLVAFRVFDIVKPPPIRRIDERVHGGLGVMVDDWAAGVMAMPLVWLAVWLV